MKNSLALSSALVAVAVIALHAQTRITPPKNSTTPADDVRKGLAGAGQARQRYPLLNDAPTSAYITALGARLVAAIPPEFRHEEFKYSFETLNVKEINAFALPGGPMFVNRGMIEAATNEGEVAGVMAHEISHVVLRHGTAEPRKSGWLTVGQIAGIAGGAYLGGASGASLAADLGNIAESGFRMRYSRDDEKQADLEGARIMSLAGYDPRDMANMFRTIDKTSASGPQWASDHPNPGNRVEYITKEAKALPIANVTLDGTGFQRVREHLKTLPPPPTPGAVTKAQPAANPSMANGRIGGTIEPPATRLVQYSEGDLFTITVPANWKELPSRYSVTFAPTGAYGVVDTHTVFTHGVEAGIESNTNKDLTAASEAFVAALKVNNPKLVEPSVYRSVTIDGRRWVQATLTNVSEATNRDEVIQVMTTLLKSGNVFYVLGVAPKADLPRYEAPIQSALGSIRLTN